MSAATGNKQIVEAYFESYPDLSLANDEFEPFSKGYQAALKAVIANTSTNKASAPCCSPRYHGLLRADGSDHCDNCGIAL